MSVKGIRAVRSEAGIASLMVTMILMIVISLIVLGFAQVSRREQRQSLDQQLNTQAFYAAETGVNDAQKVIQQALASPPGIVPDKTQCGDPGSGPYHTLLYSGATPAADLDPTHNISYTCLLVSTTVPTLTNTLAPDSSWVVPLHTVNSSGAPTSPGNLTFSWPAADPGQGSSLSGCPSDNGNPNGPIPNLDSATYQACPYGVLRLDLVPIYAGPVARNTLMNDDLVTFFYPTVNSHGRSGNITYVARATGTHQVSASCNASSCSGTVGISGTAAQAATMFYARVTMLYKGTGTNGNVSIGANSGVYFSGAQAQIDSTGKAQDVLRRIRVSVSINQSNTTIPFAPGIASRDSICKRYTVGQGIAPTIQIGPNPSENNPQCNGSATPAPPGNESGDIGSHCNGNECPNQGGGNNKGGPAPDYVWTKTIWVTSFSNKPTSCVLYPDLKNTAWTIPGNQYQCTGKAAFYPNYGNVYPQIEKAPITCHVYTAQVIFTINGTRVPSKQTVTARIPQGAKKPAGC